MANKQTLTAANTAFFFRLTLGCNKRSKTVVASDVHISAVPQFASRAKAADAANSSLLTRSCFTEFVTRNKMSESSFYRHQV